MKILAITSIRSDYDLLSPLFFKLQQDTSFVLKLLVGGAHNSTSFGHTVDDIKNDGFDILMEIESLLDSNTSAGRLKSASILLISAIDVVKSFNPDLIIYAGDREEVMVGALLGGYLSIPTIHFYGGDHAADGHIDNPIRHAVSKLSTCHFVSTDEHMRRLLSLGEPTQRIFNIGSIALDKFNNVKPIPNIKGLIANKAITKPTAILIYHPIDEEKKISTQLIDTMVESINSAGYHCFLGLPNSDPGNAEIRSALKHAAEKYEDVTLYGNLSREQFVNLFKQSSLIVGNSSAGLLEAASIPVACVNVGARQRGRYSTGNVLFVDATPKAIKQGIKQASSPEFTKKLAQISNPYGNGNSAELAYSLIKENNFRLILGKKEDPLKDEN